MPDDFQWSLVIDRLPDGVSVHSPSGEVLWVNKTLCEIYGQSSSLMKGLSCEQLFHDEASPCAHEQVLATGIAADVGNISVAGRILSVRIEPIFNKDERTSGFIRIARDVNGGNRIEREQLLTTERFATLGRVLFGLAHNIGTPLNIITGYAEFLLMRTKPADAGHKEMSTILQQTRRIAQLISEALDLARTPQRRFDSIDIKGVLTDVLELVGHDLRRTNVKAAVTCGIGSALIYGETMQLRQAFFNLVLNAGQRVGKGGKLEIIIEESEKPGFITVAFWGSDASGTGHDFSRSLVAFLADQSEAEPPGIGLSLAKEILSEASATVASRESGPRGAALLVDLPVNPTG